MHPVTLIQHILIVLLIDVNIVPDVVTGGLDIVADDGKNYKLPENIVYGDNNFTNISNIYQGLKLKGTLKHDSKNNNLIALYAIDYDESKVDNNNNNNNNNHYTSDDESLNKYVEELIKAMTFNIEEDLYCEWTKIICENIKPELLLFGHTHKKLRYNQPDSTWRQCLRMPKRIPKMRCFRLHT